jgi:hypothetical protein
MSEPLYVLRTDLVKIVEALRAGQKIAKIRLTTGAKPRPFMHVDPVTISGEGWTLYLNLLNSGGKGVDSANGFQLFGDRERFEEDFILAKMSVC